MQTLVANVPGAAASEQEQKRTSMRNLSPVGGSDGVDSAGGGSEALDLDEIMVYESAPILPAGVDINDYTLISRQSQVLSGITEILELYRLGGRLSDASLLRILQKGYKMLKETPNLVHLTLTPQCKLTIVGDLHGQLHDLLRILDESGLPSASNKYIFNGDFVDRGPHGVEVFTILMALATAYPQSVVLNRGNHEDAVVCRIYGFHMECTKKYDEHTFGMFCEVFRYLPLFTVVNNCLFVTHGGLFHDENVKLADLEQIERADYVPKPAIPFPQNCEGLSEEGVRQEYLRQLQRDALWSDPMPEKGCELNPRGAGVAFGPDICQKFLENNGLQMIVRSHECVRFGADFPYADSDAMARYNLRTGLENDIADVAMRTPLPLSPGEPLLCTLFSASNYASGDNYAAYMVVMMHQREGSNSIGNSGLSFTLHRFKTSETPTAATRVKTVSSLADTIFKKKAALLLAFQTVDESNAGSVTRIQWADIMQKVTGVKIRWLALLKNIAPSDSLHGNFVNYQNFLLAFSAKTLHAGYKPRGELSDEVMEAMYSQKRQLETIFYFFDSNGDGVISYDEFRKGCEVLNSKLPSLSADRLVDVDRMLSLIDFKKLGHIDMNEFFEVFRLVQK